MQMKKTYSKLMQHETEDLSMANFSTRKLSLLENGADTCLAISHTASKHQNMLNVTGPFLGLLI
jgi:hypothetical protein